MAKPYTISGLQKRKEYRFEFFGLFRQLFGNPSRYGMWIIYGEEKHGKTWFSLLLAEFFSKFVKTLYVSAEEGLDEDFRAAIERAKLQQPNKQLLFTDYIGIDELEEQLTKRNHPKVIFIDNITVYVDELKYGKLRYLHQKYKRKVLFVFIAHEENNEPYTATAKLAKRLAKVIVRVEGLAASISGRCPGGNFMINEEKAQLYHGSEIKNPQ